ncbi:S8 family serine peptidase [uncultured Ruminococcus sp.]|uniref:S8 family serine peptidase n=1 Tax=uncultured Ruminococcus sp. TaxID=165186 RepID=UPI002621EF93|nr:S8 family serine peptidase [uncultured Ruminococcus sp.]
MKHTFTNRAFCLAAAAVFGFCGTGWQRGSAIRASAAEAAECTAPGTDPVKVIVRIDGDAVLSGEEAAEDGIAYMDTEDAAAQTDTLQAQQQAVEKHIRALYPELNVKYRYTLLTNGFSCMLPEDLIPAVEALPGVSSVERVQDIEVPMLARAQEIGGIPAFQNDTGCTGEGQVIAVLDSELDVTHPMFAALADDIDTALTKDDITELAESGSLHLDIDPERAYISSKLPYVVDYVDDDIYGGVANPDAYHGTHVSSIAAGNTFTTADGDTISGIAKDAQIVFMSCGEHGYYVSTEAAMAALEDAVRLHADVINMSWGTYADEAGGVIDEAMTACDNAGINICMSAGNADNGENAFGRHNKPAYPDITTINVNVAPDSGAMLVASVNNDSDVRRSILKFGDVELCYRPMSTIFNQLIYLSEKLPLGDYELVDCGDGTKLSFRMPELKGKLMLIQRGMISFQTMAYYAETSGAVGIILIDKEDSDGMEYVPYYSDAPFACITYEEGQMLKNAVDPVLTNDGTYVVEHIDPAVSLYTSWGVGSSLDLRPDIAGIGGSVKAAAYGGGTEVMSGTSMSSPFLAGCTAIARQYLKENGLTAEGREKVDYVRNMLMNAAEPMMKNDKYVQPRRQGAGLVAMDRLSDEKVMMTGSEGSAKINLYDMLGDDFSFDVTLENISTEDVAFTDASLVLMTDGSAYDPIVGYDVISGQRMLNCTADLSGLLESKAGETRKETISVSLDPAETAAVVEAFCNGFFVEGYLLLKGAENCCDISIPLLGFHGDWGAVPIIDESSLRDMVLFNNCCVPSGTIGEVLPLLQDIINRIPTEYISYIDGTVNLDVDIEEYATAEELQELKSGSVNSWISPNDDGLADSFYGLQGHTYRQGSFVTQIIDPEGNLLHDYSDELPVPHELGDDHITHFTANGYYSKAFDFGKCEDGEYTFRIGTHAHCESSENNPQFFEKSFWIDREAPDVESKVYEQDGRKILALTCSDNMALDCVYVIGNGEGYALDAEMSKCPLNAQELLELWCGLYRTGNVLNTVSDAENISDLPAFLTALSPDQYAAPKHSLTALYSFADCIPLSGKDESVTLEYDITDLTDYTITVLDKAYNYVVAAESEESTIETIPEGLWLHFGQGLYEFRGDKVRYMDFLTTSVHEGSYKLNNNILTIDGIEGIPSFKVQFYSNEKMKWEDTETGTASNVVIYSYYENLDEVKMYPLETFTEIAKEKFEDLTGFEVTNVDYYLEAPNSFSLQIHYINENGEEDIEYANASLITGYVSFFRFGTVEVNVGNVASITPGTYYENSEEAYYVFYEDGESGMVFTNGYQHMGRPNNNSHFTYTIDEKGNMVFYADDGEHKAKLGVNDKGVLRITWENCSPSSLLLYSEIPYTQEEHYEDEQLRSLVQKYYNVTTGENCELTYGVLQDNGNISYFAIDSLAMYGINPFTLKGVDGFGNAIDLNEVPALSETAIPLETLKEWAINDYQKKNETEPARVIAAIAAPDKVMIELDDENYEAKTYTIDPETGIGTDADGEEINLPQTGNNDVRTVAACAGAMLLILAGAAAIARSRRENSIK